MRKNTFEFELYNSLLKEIDEKEKKFKALKRDLDHLNRRRIWMLEESRGAEGWIGDKSILESIIL